MSGSTGTVRAAALLGVGSVVAASFGGYGAALFFGERAAPGWRHLLTTLVVLLVAVITLAGARTTGRLRSVVVLVLPAGFAVTVVVTVAELGRSGLAPSGWPPGLDVLSGVALTFVAFLGFAVVTGAGGDLPRATHLALVGTTVLYALVALGVFGTLAVQVAGGGTALAGAAGPVLGDTGAVVVAIAALLATTSSVNATLHAAARSHATAGLHAATSSHATAGRFPPGPGRSSRAGSTRGLLVPVGLVLLLANLVDLAAVPPLGSAVTLAVFLVTSVAVVAPAVGPDLPWSRRRARGGQVA